MSATANPQEVAPPLLEFSQLRQLGRHLFDLEALAQDKDIPSSNSRSQQVALDIYMHGGITLVGYAMMMCKRRWIGA